MKTKDMIIGQYNPFLYNKHKHCNKNNDNDFLNNNNDDNCSSSSIDSETFTDPCEKLTTKLLPIKKCKKRKFANVENDNGNTKEGKQPKKKHKMVLTKEGDTEVTTTTIKSKCSNFDGKSFRIPHLTAKQSRTALHEIKTLNLENDSKLIHESHPLKSLNGVTAGEFCLSYILHTRPNSVRGNKEEQWKYPFCGC